MANHRFTSPPVSDWATRLALAVTNSGTGIWDRDIASGRIEYSDAWKAMLGYADAEIGNCIDDSYGRVHPDDLAGVQAAIAAHLDQRTPVYEVEHRLRCKDGSYKWVLSRGKVVSRDAGGKALRMSGVTTDISETVALSEKLRCTAELLTDLTDQVPGLVYQYREEPGGQASFPYASAGIAEIFGTTPALAAASATVVEEVIHPDDREMYHASLADSAATLERWHLEFRVLLPAEGERWCQADARPRRLPDGATVWHGFISDITGRKQVERQFQDAAATDFLTGLPNRRHLMSRIEQELARLQRDPAGMAAVLMLDLDHFKGVNDRYGHATGDAVLRHVSQLLLPEMRKSDLVGRIGGEEFAAILPGTELHEAFAIGERLRARFACAPYSEGERTISVTVSIGIAIMTGADTAVAGALSRADAALYRAKQQGRDRVEAAA